MAPQGLDVPPKERKRYPLLPPLIKILPKKENAEKKKRNVERWFSMCLNCLRIHKLSNKLVQRKSHYNYRDVKSKTPPLPQKGRFGGGGMFL